MAWYEEFFADGKPKALKCDKDIWKEFTDDIIDPVPIYTNKKHHSNRFVLGKLASSPDKSKLVIITSYTEFGLSVHETLMADVFKNIKMEDVDVNVYKRPQKNGVDKVVHVITYSGER